MTSQRTTTPFAELYPFATFETIADAAWWRSSDYDSRKGDFDRAAYDAAIAADRADQERLDAHKRIFAEAVAAHLAALNAAGRLSPITGLSGRGVTLATAWNDMVAGKTATYERKWLLQSFDRLFVDEFVRMDDSRHRRRREDCHQPGSHQAPSPEQAKTAWNGICARMDAGTSKPYERGLAIECNDEKTGARCEIHFDAWRPVLMVRNARHDLEPAQDVATAKLVTADFPVPTGHLLLTDYLRVEGFREGVEFASDRDYDELSLNSARGRDARIAAHAEEHGIAYAQTTNTCVAIHRHPATGMLMVTQRWQSTKGGREMPEDANDNSIVKGWESVGSFSCDMWRIMALDRSTALARMSAGGNQDAETALDAYLASNEAYARNVARLEVEPGLWRIHAGDEFSERVSRRKHDIPRNTFVWCLLERVGDLAEARD